MSVRTLPVHPHLDHLRHQAKDLHRAATSGDPEALVRLGAASADASADLSLSTAQLALAREYGFASWRRLKAEVERLRTISAGDIVGLAALVAADPALASEPVRAPVGDAPLPLLDYVGIGLLHGWWDHHRAGDLTRVLLAAGASDPGDEGADPALITAASHGEPDMVRALLDAGADLEATGRAAPGSGTALAHAVHYGIIDAVDVLVSAGAVVHDLVEAAGVGDIAGYLDGIGTTPPADLARALRAAAVCERLDVIDQLLDTGLDVNIELTTLTESHGATVLHCAAWDGKARSVAHLLSRGADPNRRVAGPDGHTPNTALDWCRARAGVGHGGEHAAVERMLAPLTTT